MNRAQAMILAAGRGERMRPLTDHCPKPLLEVRGKPLVCHHLDALLHAGVRDAVINTAWLGEQIERRVGTVYPDADDAGGSDRMHIRYSREGADFGGALETAGGIARALPMLDDVFWLVGGDVHAPDFVFARDALARFAAGTMLAHLFLVPNPPHNPRGDFACGKDGLVLNRGEQMHTYSTIALMRQSLFKDWEPGNQAGLKAPLAPLLRRAADNGRLSGEIHAGRWTDVGTPQRLMDLNTP